MRWLEIFRRSVAAKSDGWLSKLWPFYAMAKPPRVALKYGQHGR
jgi:hypothetical protein